MTTAYKVSATLTNGSAAVNVTDGALTVNAYAGATLKRGGVAVDIKSINAASGVAAITLEEPWPGVSGTGDAWISRTDPQQFSFAEINRKYSQALEALARGYTLTSASPLSIGLGAKTFVVADGLPILPGARMLAASRANLANSMWGTVTEYSGNVLTLSVESVSGAGTFADWNINLAGNTTQGPPGQMTRSGAQSGGLARFAGDALLAEASPDDIAAAASVSQFLLFNLLEDGGRFAGAPDAQGVSVGAFVPPPYLMPYNGASFAQGGRFYHNNATYGGTAAALAADVDGAMQLLRSSAYRRYGPEFYVLTLTAGAGVASPQTVGGVTHYLVTTSLSAPLWALATWGYSLKVQSGSAAVFVTSSADCRRDGNPQSASFRVLDSDAWTQIVMRANYTPDTYNGYDNNLLRLYATPGAVISIALPFVFPGRLPPNGSPFGVIPSLRVWR